MNSTKPRLAVVLSHPTQYYSPWFRWLRRNTALEFRVFYLWEFGIKPTRDPQFQTTFSWDVDLLSGYDHEFVPNVSREPGTHRFFGLRNPSLGPRLNAWKPNAVLLFGYAYATHLGVILWARRHHVPLIFRGDSHFLGGRRPSASARLLLRMLYAQFDAVTYVGTANRDYFTELAVPAGRLFFAPHSVDSALFDPTRAEYRVEAARLRTNLGIAPNTRVLCYAGKLIPAKQPRQLLQAFLDVRPRDSSLVFVGDGEERSALRELARSSSANNVFFLPFANQTGMPSRYLMADVFALPSRGLYETWGLAVNEAMQLGIPCLVSDRVGCQRDLVIDNETGWVFRADEPAHLRERLAASLAADLGPIKRNVSQRISGFAYRHTADGLLHAIAAVCGQPPGRSFASQPP